MLAAAAALAYGVHWVVPAYRGFSDHYWDERAWAEMGLSDPTARERHIEACIAAQQSMHSSTPAFAGTSTPYPLEEQSELEISCFQPTWDPWRFTHKPADSVRAFVGTVWPRLLIYAIGAVLLAPWAAAFVLVRVIPAGMLGVARWLSAPDRR